MIRELGAEDQPPTTTEKRIANGVANVNRQFATYRLTETFEVAEDAENAAIEAYGHVLAVLQHGIRAVKPETCLLEPLVVVLVNGVRSKRSTAEGPLIPLLAALTYGHYSSPALFEAMTLFYVNGGGFDALGAVLANTPQEADLASFARQCQLHGKASRGLSEVFLRFLIDEFPVLLGLVRLLEALAKEPFDNSDLCLSLYAFLEYIYQKHGRMELGTLVFANKGLLETFSRLKSHPSIGETNQKAISSIVALVNLNMVPLHVHWCPGSGKLQLVVNLDLHEAIGLQMVDKRECFRHLLEFIDLNATVDFAEETSATTLLVVSLLNATALSCENRLFHAFNRCHSKISLSVLLTYLTHMVSANLLDFVDSRENIPSIIRSNFALLSLPALARPKSLCGSPEKDAYGNDLTVVGKADNLANAIYAIALGLNLLSTTLKADFSALSVLSAHFSNQLSLKLVFGKLDLVFSSLATSLMCVEKLSAKEDPTLDSVRKFAYLCFKKVLSLKLPCTDTSMVWVSLINFANDVCFSDVSYVGLFEGLFSELVRDDGPADFGILDDKLVKGGLDFFVESFGDGTAVGNLAEMLGHHNQLHDLVEMDPAEFKFLYSSWKTSSSSETPFQETGQGPASRAYAVNHARQQSVHVDQYGR